MYIHLYILCELSAEFLRNGLENQFEFKYMRESV